VNITTHTTPDAQEETIRIAPRVPEQLWRRVKAQAAMHGTTAEAIVVEAIEEYLEEE